MMGMRYKLLGRTGLRVSELCLGAMIFGDRRGGWGASKDEAARIVARFADAGGNFVDTANAYAGGESERIVGELVAGERERWVLSTKYSLSMRPDDPNGGGAHLLMAGVVLSTAIIGLAFSPEAQLGLLAAVVAGGVLAESAWEHRKRRKGLACPGMCGLARDTVR